MKPEDLRRFARARRPGVFLDFDGTLSDIVDVPSDARPIPGARELLERMGKRFAVAAVVSGRSAHQLVEWLGPGVEIWGIHGAQHARAGAVHLSERAAPYRQLMSRVRDEAERRLAATGIEGLLVEDKGIVVNLHYRKAEDRSEAERRLHRVAEELADGYGVVVGRGRLTFELKPSEEFSKAIVVRARAHAEHLDAVMFVGDDAVDIPAFDALEELAADGTFTLKVAVRSDEVPRELLERADVVVDGPSGVMGFLSDLLKEAG